MSYSSNTTGSFTAARKPLTAFLVVLTSLVVFSATAAAADAGADLPSRDEVSQTCDVNVPSQTQLSEEVGDGTSEVVCLEDTYSGSGGVTVTDSGETILTAGSERETVNGTIEIDAKDVTIRGIKVTHPDGQHAIEVNADATIKNNVVYKVGTASSALERYAIEVNGADDVTISGNEIRKVRAKARASGITFRGDQSRVTGASVTNNLIHDIKTTALDPKPDTDSDGYGDKSKSKGIAADGEVDGITISHNTVRDIGDESTTFHANGVVMSENNGHPENFVITYNEFSNIDNDEEYADYTPSTVYVTGYSSFGNEEISHNDFLSDNTRDVEKLASGGDTLKAEQNYFGSDGRVIDGDVDYAPWLGKEVGSDPQIYYTDTSGTIQAAVNAADSGDRVKVREGTYTETVSITTEGLTLTSTGTRENTVIDANGNGPVVRVNAPDVKVSGFTITGATGDGEEGQGIIASAASGDRDTNADGVIFEDLIVEDNYDRGVVIDYVEDAELRDIITRNNYDRDGLGGDTPEGGFETNGEADGVTVWHSNSTVLEDITAINNSDNGIYLKGENHELTGVVARNNGDEGVDVSSDLSMQHDHSGGAVLEDINSTGNRAAGIEVEDDEEGVTINGATLWNNPYGLIVADNGDSAEADDAQVSIHNAIIKSNSEAGVANNGEGTLDAERNYWGQPQGPTESQTEGDVKYTPWYATSQMEKNVKVQDDGDTRAYSATIQGGVDAANSGEVVEVDPGSYDGFEVSAKALTIEGPNAGIRGNASDRPSDEAVVQGTVNIEYEGVNLDGFKISSGEQKSAVDFNKLGEDGEPVTVVNSIISGQESNNGVTVSTPGDVDVERNLIQNSKNGVLVRPTATDVSVTGNEIKGSEDPKPDNQYTDGAGVKITDDSENPTVPGEVKNNLFTDNGVSFWLEDSSTNEVRTTSGSSELVGDVLSQNSFDRAVTVDVDEKGYLTAVYSSIQDGVDASGESDTVRVLPGTYESFDIVEDGVSVIGSKENNPVIQTDSTGIGVGTGTKNPDNVAVKRFEVQVTDSGGKGVRADGEPGSEITGLELSKLEIYRSGDSSTSPGVQLIHLGEDGGKKSSTVEEVKVRGFKNGFQLQQSSYVTLKKVKASQSVIPEGFDYPAGNGIKIADTEDAETGIEIADSTISGNEGDGVYVNGVGGAETEVEIKDSVIEENDQYGVLAEEMTGTVNADRNYWGHPTGPNRTTPGGTFVGRGARVSDNVDYTPWLPVPQAASGRLEIAPQEPSTDSGEPVSFTATFIGPDHEVDVTEEVDWSAQDGIGAEWDGNELTVQDLGTWQVTAELASEDVVLDGEKTDSTFMEVNAGAGGGAAGGGGGGGVALPDEADETAEDVTDETPAVEQPEQPQTPPGQQEEEEEQEEEQDETGEDEETGQEEDTGPQQVEGPANPPGPAGLFAGAAPDFVTGFFQFLGGLFPF